MGNAKITLNWKSDKAMRALFSNIGETDPNCFYLVAVFHNSRKGGFGRTITVTECQDILRKYNHNYYLRLNA